MAEHPHPGRTNVPSETETEPMGGCLTRLGWLIIAPLALAALGITLARNGSGPWAWESLAYWGVVAAALALRYLDVFRLSGDTVSGKPASRKDWQRYAVVLPSLAFAAWGLAVWLG